MTGRQIEREDESQPDPLPERGVVRAGAKVEVKAMVDRPANLSGRLLIGGSEALAK